MVKDEWGTIGMKENAARDKSFTFALGIIHLARDVRRKGERELARQLIRSGTSIGANVEEAQAAQTRKDFHSKMTIALKEAWETRYWLRLVKESGSASSDLTGILTDIDELIRIITSIAKSTGERELASDAVAKETPVIHHS